MHISPGLATDLLTVVMVFVTVALALWAAFGKSDRAAGALAARLTRLGLVSGDQGSDEQDEEARAREVLQKALAELDMLKRRQGRFYLTRLLRSSGLQISLAKHLMITALLGGVVFAIAWVLGLPVLSAAAAGAAVGAGLPVLYLQYLTQRRMAVFAGDLPGALELIVRGIRAGLPLLECLKLAADEWNEPLRGEFLQVTNDMGLGLSIREAISRFADRVPVQEARLFAIVISIQAQSGGNLSEVLTNLADLLREKVKLQSKIRALTSEARTSAWIIGSIPVLLIAAVSVLSPGFLQPLFDTDMGNLILGLCGAWMLFGFVIMRSMMRVDL